MAIGLGKIMGFSFKENFRAPYSAASVTDFWRRWHVSLSSWLRDYLYIPLGGSRAGTGKQYRNLLLVFVVCGLWHGANWTFLAWGLYHGGWLVLERATGWSALLARLPRALSVAITFTLVSLGWVWFRADDLAHACGFFARLFGAHSLLASGTVITWGELLSHRAAAWGLLGLLVCFAPASTRLAATCDWFLGKREAVRESWRSEILRFGCAGTALLLSVMALVNAKFNPFIYFRF